MLKFKGTFSYNFMTAFGEKFEQEYRNVLPNKEFRASFFILNELMQNISLYSYQKAIADNKEYGVGSIEIEVLDDVIKFVTQNAVSEKNLLNLKSRIINYNALSFDELKQLSKEKRKMEQEADSKGGGIGLIEIRKKAKSKIRYKTIKLINNEEIRIIINIHRGA